MKPLAVKTSSSSSSISLVHQLTQEHRKPHKGVDWFAKPCSLYLSLFPACLASPLQKWKRGQVRSHVCRNFKCHMEIENSLLMNFPLSLLQPFPARMATIAHTTIIIIITIIIAAVARIIITVIKFHTMATTRRSIWIAWNPMAIYPLIKQIADMAVSKATETF